MFLSQKLERMDDPKQKEQLLASIASHSVISWAHTNMLGEYDFSDNKLKDSVGILPPKKSQNIARRNGGTKINKNDAEAKR